MMENHCDVSREEVVHYQDNHGQGHHRESSEEAKVPGPTKVGVQTNQFTVIVGKWEDHGRIVIMIIPYEKLARTMIKPVINMNQPPVPITNMKSKIVSR